MENRENRTLVKNMGQPKIQIKILPLQRPELVTIRYLLEHSRVTYV